MTQDGIMTIDPAELELRRRAARRTGLLLAGVAFAIYALFLLSRWFA